MLKPSHLPTVKAACCLLCLGLILVCLGCSEPDYEVLHLQDYGAKITERDNGIAIDIRNAPDFDDQAIDLLLPHAKELVDLTMQKVGITDAGIAKLEPLTEVGRLILNDTAVTGKALAQLSQLPMRDKLWNLGLKNTAITDDSLKMLTELPNVIRIDLTGTKVTDKGIPNFANRNWMMINVKETAVSNAGVEQLKKMFPGADIAH